MARASGRDDTKEQGERRFRTREIDAISMRAADLCVLEIAAPGGERVRRLADWQGRDGRGLSEVRELDLASVQSQVVLKLNIQG